jgi:hypothetical protein
VYGNPSHPYTRALLDAVPVPDPVLQRKKLSESAADVLVVSSLFIDSPVMRRLRAAGLPVVASKVFLEARSGAVLAAKRWGVG